MPGTEFSSDSIRRQPAGPKPIPSPAAATPCGRHTPAGQEAHGNCLWIPGHAGQDVSKTVVKIYYRKYFLLYHHFLPYTYRLQQVAADPRLEREQAELALEKKYQEISDSFFEVSRASSQQGGQQQPPSRQKSSYQQPSHNQVLLNSSLIKSCQQDLDNTIIHS